MTTRLTQEGRSRALERMRRDVVDVIIVGGGVTGCGAALDAATRGLSVALLEAHDYAFGTSSRSTKLIHGGLRYLEQLNFALVKEALRERSLLIRKLAPHLVYPVPFMYPLQRRTERPYVGAGMILYDTMGGARRGVPRHQHWSHAKAARINPGLKADAFLGAIRYYDGGVDDARHTMFLARTAVHHGALAANRVEVVGVLREAGAVVGVRARDAETGEEFDVRGRAVINATGPWADKIQQFAGRAAVKVRPSKGVHLVVDRQRIPLTTGLITRTEKSVLFIVPWGRYWLIGTTDTDWEHGVEEPTAHQGDIDYILEHANAVLASPLTADDVIGVFAGVRPLVAPATEGATTAISREHAVTETFPGLYTITGGKYTTYRVMAKDVIDVVAPRMPRRVPGSITHQIPLLGAVGYEARLRQKDRLAMDSGLSVAWIEHLLGRYGDLVDELLDLIVDDPSLAEPLPGADGYLAAEARYAASHEGALHLSDVLGRRTHATFETPDRGLSAARPTAHLVAETLSWDEARLEEEIERFQRDIAALRAAEAADSDEAAVQAREAALTDG
jgi:glycerol-3-phosphate dehydrogenase